MYNVDVSETRFSWHCSASVHVISIAFPDVSKHIYTANAYLQKQIKKTRTQTGYKLGVREDILFDIYHYILNCHIVFVSTVVR